MDLADAAVYPKRGMTTQYQETDLAFLQRLLAEEGLFCWFEHKAEEGDSLGQHRLVIADHNAAFKATARARDHRKWVESARLVDAFDVYSRINLGCGFSFRAHQLLYMDGMFGEKSNQDLLVKCWSSDEIERTNLCHLLIANDIPKASLFAFC